MRGFRLALVVAAAVWAVAAASLATAGPAPKPGRTHEVVIAGMAFGPTPAGLHVGDTIKWVNNDIFLHSATAKDGGFNVDIAPKARARTVLRKPGVVSFYCKYHPGMTGRLVVAN